MGQVLLRYRFGSASSSSHLTHGERGRLDCARLGNCAQPARKSAALCVSPRRVLRLLGRQLLCNTLDQNDPILVEIAHLILGHNSKIRPQENIKAKRRTPSLLLHFHGDFFEPRPTDLRCVTPADNVQSCCAQELVKLIWARQKTNGGVAGPRNWVVDWTHRASKNIIHR